MLETVSEASHPLILHDAHASVEEHAFELVDLSVGAALPEPVGRGHFLKAKLEPRQFLFVRASVGTRRHVRSGELRAFGVV